MRIAGLLLILLACLCWCACGTAKGRYDGEELADDDATDDHGDDDDNDATDDDDDDYEKIDDFTWTDVDGNKIHLYDLAGNVILLDVGGGYCAPCREATPSLQKDIWERFQNDNFQLIQLIVADDYGVPADDEFARGWRDQYDLTYTVCADPDWSLEPYFLDPNLPFTMLLDAELGIRFRTHAYDAQALIYLIEELL